MIFKTQNNELAIFGKTLTDVRNRLLDFTTIYEQYGLQGENGAIASLFGNKKSVNILTPELEDEFKMFQEMFNNSSKSAEVLSEELGGVDNSIVNYAKSCKNGSLTMEGFKESLNGLSLGAKASKLALSALATVGNMFLSWAFTKGIELAVTAIHNYINRVEIAKEKTIELVNNYESITSEITTLEGKLEDLNDQINGLDPITNEQDIKNLKLETAELNAQLAILREKQAIAKQEAEDAATESLSMKQGSKYAFDDKTYVDYTTGTTYEGKAVREVTSYEELELAMDAYDKYADKVLELQEELANLEETDPEYSKVANEIEEWSDKMQDARKDASELETAIQSQIDALPDGHELKGKISPIIESYLEWIGELNGTTDALKENGNAIDDVANKIATFKIEPFNETMQSYEEGYSKLISAREEWNNANALSAETFADLQESGLLEYIEFTSDGLTVNTDKLLENAQATKDKAVADLHAAMTNDMLQIALGNVDSISEEAKTVIAELGNNTEEAGQQALSSVANWATLGATITDTMARARGEDRGFNGVTNEQKAQMEAVYDYYYSMAEKVSAIDITVPDRTKKAKDSAKKTSDEYLKAFEEELKKLKALKEQGKISESEFLAEYKVLYEKYFKDIDKYAEEFAEHQHERFKGLKDLYDSAISAISKLKDEEIDALNETKDNALEALEKERDARLDVIDAQKEQLESQLDLIDKQIEAKEDVIDGIQGEIDLIQDEIDAMREANDERKRQIDLQKAQYDLERMQNQRVNLIYKDGQMVYENDESGIRDAREAVSDAKLEIDIAEKEKEIAQKEKEIDLIEKEIELFEKQKDAINEQIDALEKQTQSIEKYYDTLIEQQEKFYDSMIESLEKQKSAWEELAEVKEVADAYSAIEQVFGDLGYTVEDVLNNSSGVFEDFKTKYIDLLNTMNSNDSFGNGLSYAVDELDKSLSNAGTNTEGLDNLVSRMDDVTTSVGNVSNAINGSGMSSMATGEEVSNATGSSLKDAIAEQTSDAIAKLEEQSNAFSGGEESLEGSVQNVIDKVAGSSEEGENKNSKEKETEADTDNLIGAIQAQYDKTVEAVPQQIQYFVDFKNSIVDCVTELNNMITALERVQTLSSVVTVGGLPSITPYADGTTYAKKGLAIVAEEAPELIENKKGNIALATEPTLLNMQGGEKVYNAEKTAELLKDDQIYAMHLKAKKYLEENPALLFPTQNVWSRQMEERVNSMKTAPVVNNKSNSYNVGDIHVHCSGITSKDVAEQAVREFNKQVFGMSNEARQRASITR